MNFHQKAKHHIEDMEYLGIHKSITAPLIYRVLWSLDIQEIPPFFALWKRVFAIHALFNVLIVSMCYLAFCIVVGNSLVALISVYTLFVFLSCMLAFLKSIRYRQEAESLELPDWDTYLSDR